MFTCNRETFSSYSAENVEICSLGANWNRLTQSNCDTWWEVFVPGVWCWRFSPIVNYWIDSWDLYQRSAVFICHYRFDYISLWTNVFQWILLKSNHANSKWKIRVTTKVFEVKLSKTIFFRCWRGSTKAFCNKKKVCCKLVCTTLNYKIRAVNCRLNIEMFVSFCIEPHQSSSLVKWPNYFQTCSLRTTTLLT